MFQLPIAATEAIERRFQGVRILVLGDVMLDRHLWGSVARISPEAPVPVVRLERESASPGGAGNVALNLSSLGVQTQVVGLMGEDADGAHLRALLAQAGIDAGGLVSDRSRPTTTKTRIIGGHQQMLRLDREQAGPCEPAARAAISEAALARIPGAAAVVISDYAKGAVDAVLCQQVIQACRRQGVPVLVDPKGRDWARYRGATILKPNRSEFAAVASQPLSSSDALLAEGRRVLREFELDHLVISLSEEGILCITPSAEIRLPAAAREVFDVSGAGDTVVATLAAGLAAQLSIDDAMRMANLAAGVVVGKVGTVPITQEELLAAVLEHSQSQHDVRIFDLPHLQRRLKLWRARGERIVFTNGCFDLLHVGHVTYLEQARAQGDRLIVGLNTDRSVRALKGPTRPINREQDRALVLSSLAAVDGVILFDEDTPLSLITTLQPDVLVKGADYTVEQVVGATEVRAWGGEVRLIPLVPGVSTTAIAGRVKGGS